MVKITNSKAKSSDLKQPKHPRLLSLEKVIPEEWRTEGGGGGLGGQLSPPIDDLKKTLFLKQSAFFHTEFTEIAVIFF